MNHNDDNCGNEPTSGVLIINPKFPIGSLVITRIAHEALLAADIQRAIQRHVSGDWGEVCEEDWRKNNRSLAEGSRLLSGYYSSNGTRFWVITEADRSATTVLLPQDY